MELLNVNGYWRWGRPLMGDSLSPFTQLGLSVVIHLKQPA